MMRRRDMMRAMLLSPVALYGSACAGVWQVLRGVWQEPEVKFRRMQIESIALDLVKTRFFLDVTNPNPLPIHLGGLGYGLALDGNRVLQGSIDRAIDVPARGRAPIQVPLEVPLGESGEAVLRLLQKDKVEYALDTRFRFRWGEGQIELPVRFSGEIPVPKLPTVHVREFRFTSIRPSGLGVAVTTTVTNPNDFNLPIDRLRFLAKLNGRTVLRNQEIENLSLKAKQTRDFRLNFSVDLLDVGLSALALSKRPRMKWEVEGALEAGVVKLPLRLKGNVPLR